MSIFRSIDSSSVTPIHLLSNLISRKPDMSFKPPAALVQKRVWPRDKVEDRCNRKLNDQPVWEKESDNS